MNAHRAFELAAVAGALTGVIAYAPVDGRKRVGLNEKLPCSLFIPLDDLAQPALDVFARWTCLVTGREEILVDGPSQADGSRRTALGEIWRDGEITVFDGHGKFS